MKKKITVKYLRESMPEWKKKKDPLLIRLITRPLSFYISAFLANHGVSANTVSYFSGYIAIFGACCFLCNLHFMNILGAAFVFIWLILDCVDGNLARSVKSQPFGEFADALSSYILIALLITFIGYAAYNEGGLLVSAGHPWIILLGAIASSSDTLMRLIYQKYKNVERDMSDRGIVPAENDIFRDHSKVGDWKIRFNMEMGIGSFLTLLIIVASILKWLDIVVIYCAFYYGCSCVGTYVLYVRKAVEKQRVFQKNMPQPQID